MRLRWDLHGMKVIMRFLEGFHVKQTYKISDIATLTGLSIPTLLVNLTLSGLQDDWELSNNMLKLPKVTDMQKLTTSLISYMLKT